MDLPDCPPGTEGYEDDASRTSSNIPKDASKGEREFAEYLHGLKLQLENGTTGRVLEQRTRDQSGQLVYVCYPCSVTLYGEYMAKAHINGKKHLLKLESRRLWPKGIYDNHPFENTLPKIETPVVNKPAGQGQAVKPAGAPQSDDFQFDLGVVCKIQPDLDNFLNNPLIGLEYLVEILPNEEHHAPMYCCVLCSKTGHNSTMLNHLICMHHNFRYISVHFKAIYFAIKNVKPNRAAFRNVMDSLMQAIEENYGRMRPVQCTQLQWETHNAAVSRAITKREHISEKMGKSFVEILDPNLMQHLSKDDEASDADSNAKNAATEQRKRDPSPPVVAAPSRPANYRHRREASPIRKARDGSVGALSNVSSEHSPHKDQSSGRYQEQRGGYRGKHYVHGYESGRGWVHRGRGRGGFGYHPHYDSRYKAEPYHEEHRDRERHSEIPYSVVPQHTSEDKPAEVTMPAHERRKFFYKLKKYTEKTQIELDMALKALAYHEKNPEKHPQYPDEWKKFWNRRYKEVKAESKDPSTHDFKPEWIIFWTKRMVELHEEKMEGKKKIVRKQLGFPIDKSPTRDLPMNLHSNQKKSPPHRIARSRSPRWRPPSTGRRSRSPAPRRRSPLSGRLSPRRRNPSPGGYGRRPSPIIRTRKISTPRDLRETRHSKSREDFRPSSSRDEFRPRQVELKSSRSKSPFSARGSKGSPDRLASRNRSPQPVRGAEDLSPMSLSDDDDKLKKVNALSPWGDSSSSLESVHSVKLNSSPAPARRGFSPGSRRAPPSMRYEPSSTRYESQSIRYEGPKVLSKPPASTGPEDVVPVLRLLAALEDYLGPSLGPKILDLLGEALKMEKEKPNSSENILDVDEYTSLLEMCKEKLKGKVEAGLVGTAATTAAREVISRTAALLHLAELRQQERKKEQMEAVKVTGVGAVDKAAVARQLAAALIAQGKTDVTTDELATLVDAVVGMAEAKRRAGEVQQPITIANFLEKTPAIETTKGHSALKMLQNAYEEQHKPEPKGEHKAITPVPVKEIPMNAMDDLSDSDLKTLMQNFKDLSTDEQEGLVAYLKKLEVRDPKRVENLRQFVDFGSDEMPAPGPSKMATNIVNMAPASIRIAANNGQQVQANITSQSSHSNVSLIDSDDDDYTVEEVFKSAVLKVREDLKQKEMEVVQKSIQHSKPEQQNETTTPEVNPSTKQADASRLLKLVQSTAGQGLFNAFSTQSPTPSNTSNTNTQATGTSNVTDSTWLAQRPQNDIHGMTDSDGWAQNKQTSQNMVQLGQSRVYGDIQDSNLQSDSQFSNQDAGQYVESQSESGMQDSYQNQDMEYQHQGQYPQERNFIQEKSFPQDQFQQDNFQQQGNFLQQGNFSQQDQFLHRGNFSQQDQIPQQGNYFSQDQFSLQENLALQNQFPQQRNFLQRGDFTQENQFSQQGNNFGQKDQYSQDNLLQGPYLQQSEFSHRNQFAQQGNFQQGQIPQSEMQNRTGANPNFNSRNPFQGGPQYQDGSAMGGHYSNKFRGTQGRQVGGRGRGRGGRGQYPY